jgi:eukaryotic-like serine/threonine-protein kinase
MRREGTRVVGDVIAGRYELEEIVGSGGMSSVYKAHDDQLERYVALKVLHPHFGDDEEYVERFRREARAVARLSHPNIVTVIDRGQADGRQFIVFEYIDGENLKEILEREGPLPVRRAVELGLQIADGLAFAHQHGIVHRDVKPQNVLVAPTDEAKVTDFGIARSLDVERGVTQTGTVLGTSNYLSPEQASGRPVTPATDVYSLGVVLYELLTGVVPFTGQNLVAVAMQHVHEPAPSVLERRPDVPLRLAAAIERALEKDPADRFVSMDAFAAELRRCLDELGSSDAERTLVKPGPVLRETRPNRVRTRNNRLPAILAGLGLLAAAGAIAGLLTIGGSKSGHNAPGGGGSAVTLSGVGDYDPDGNADTHADTAKNATDGDPATYWQTQTYATPAFGNLKHGLGLVLDAGSSRKLAGLTVETSTPGFEASVLAGNSPTGGFRPDSSMQTVNGSTTFTLNGATARYYVLWITQLPPGDKAKVNEVTARG